MVIPVSVATKTPSTWPQWPERRCDSGTLFERVAPVIPVRDLAAALDRHQRLGFTTQAYEGDARYGLRTATGCVGR